MKKRIVELLKKKKIAAGLTAVVLAVAVGGVAVVQQNQIPELPSYTDPVMETTIDEEETPLAAQPKVNTQTSNSTSTKKVKMKKAATKTYTKTLPATSVTSKKTSQSSNATVVTQTTVIKRITEKYKKKSKVKVVTTASTTTVTTTTTAKTNTSAGTNMPAVSGNSDNSVKGSIDVGQYASRADSRVLNAYRTLGFTAEVNPSVSYSGYYDTRNRKITLRKMDDTIYHELGHFVAFISGNTDQTAEFKAIFAQEKTLYTAFNKAYVTQNSAEYFAESFKEYTLNPTVLKSSRPKTYEAVKNAVDKFTDDRIARIQKTYSVIWK